MDPKPKIACAIRRVFQIFYLTRVPTTNIIIPTNSLPYYFLRTLYSFGVLPHHHSFIEMYLVSFQ